MKRVAILSAILEEPKTCQHEFNQIVSAHSNLIRGRMGLPFLEHNLAVISLTIVATLDEINSFTGKLGNLEQVTVKTIISKKEVDGADESVN